MKLVKVMSIFVLFSAKSYAIINGVNANDFSHSSTVALQMKYIKDGKTVYRKGTAFVVGEKKLITAGHNVFYIKDPHDVEIILSHTPCWGKNTCGEERLQVVSKLIHPNFKNNYPNPPIFDVAILEVKNILPTYLKRLEVSYDEINHTPRSYIVEGYGMSSNTIPPTSLDDFRLRIYKYEDLPLKIFSDQKIALSQSLGGFCGGDSGAPLFVTSKSGLSKAIGIAIHTTKDTSGKYQCLTNGVFTKLSFFKTCLDQNL